MKKIFLLFWAITIFFLSAMAQTAILPFGSSWKYLDNGSNQGTNWKSNIFSDTSLWKTGKGQFGYGDNDETTVVDFGSNGDSRYITTYFRKEVSFANPLDYSSFIGRVRRDDGIAVYVNGTEVYRNNLPSGNISYTTLAFLAEDDGEAVQTFTLNPSVFKAGSNIIAAEIHQLAANSTDISFDMELTGIPVTTSLPLQFGSKWKYLDDGSDQGTIWTSTPFNDASWKSGNGQLGYGDGDEATIVGSGPDSSKKAITTYFRKSIIVTNLANYLSFAANIRRDDGTVVYVNGKEALRNNLPASQIAYNTLAYLADDDGEKIQSFNINPALFNEGLNTIAVEIHQLDPTSSDISFDLSLSGILKPSIPPTAMDSIPFTFGSSWKYLDNGTDQDSSWRLPSYDDALWKIGKGQFGYGDSDEATVVDFGAEADHRYITTYFRKKFIVSDTSKIKGVTLNLKRDDGAIVYINGKEVYRNNLPSGPVTYHTLAYLADDDGGSVQSFTFSQNFLLNGVNTIAVEVHQLAANSSDLTFDLELLGISSALITRGPYLQMGNQTGVTLRWRSNVPTNSKIEVGTLLGKYNLSATKDSMATEHEVRINGLAPNTKYYYRFGSSLQTLQGDSTHYFYTAPSLSETTKSRIAVFGDCGTSVNGIQEGALNAYFNHVKGRPAELMVLLGDNAYGSGTDEEYQQNFFKAYGSTVLKNHMLYTTPGNHDYYSTDQTSRSGAYYKNFTLPTDGESGGVPSRTEAFYSFDWNNIHWLSLDSYGIEAGEYTRLYDTLGSQVNWIKRDLASNTKKWIIAFWHHPPYTMGSHNSDTEDELIKIRQNFIKILERLGVDLILCGHSHNYERSYLLNNYYGSELTFNPSVHTKSMSSARYNGTVNSCPYFTLSGQVNKGTVYVVAGSSGLIQGVQSGYPHNALPFSMNEGGMLYLEVEGNRLDAKFLRSNNTIGDQFTIMKDVNKTSTVNLQAGMSTQLTASWVGTYKWSNGATTRSITVSPTSSTSYTVKDDNNCLSDQFNVTVVGTKSITAQARMSSNSQEVEGFDFTVPNIINRGQGIYIKNSGDEIIESIITDNSGKQIAEKKFRGWSSIATNNLSAGTYYLQIIGKRKSTTKKLIVIE